MELLLPLLALGLLSIPFIALILASGNAKRIRELRDDFAAANRRFAERISALERALGGAPPEPPLPAPLRVAPPPARPAPAAPAPAAPVPAAPPPPRPTPVAARPEPEPEFLDAGPLPPAGPRARTKPAAVRADGPSLEERIGGKWFNWVGIVALLLGVAYLLKYAFEQGWISPWMQFLGGLALGVLLLGLGQVATKRGYAVLAHGFFGGGIGVLFLSWFAGYRVHGILEQPVAFAGMAASTVAAAALAIRFRSPTVATFAAIGGYLTPILLGAEEPNQVFLFTYLLILTAGLLVIGARQNWRFLLAVSFFAVLVYFLGWWESSFPGDARWTLVFVAAFFALFSAEPLLATRRPQAVVGALDPTILLLNSLGAVAGLRAVVQELAPDLTGLLFVLLAAWHAAAALLVDRRSRAGTEAARWLGHAAGVLLVLAPWQEPHLSGPGRTMAWALVALVFLAATPRAGAWARRWGAGTLLFAGLRLLAWDVPRNLLDLDPWRPLWNERGLAFAAVALPFAAVARWLERTSARGTPGDRTEAGFVLVGAVTLPIAFLSLEARNALHAWLEPALAGHPERFAATAALAITLLWGWYGSATVLVAERRGPRWLGTVGFAFLAVVLGKFVFFDLAVRGVPAALPIANVRFLVAAVLAAAGFHLARATGRREPLVAGHGIALIAATSEWHDAFLGTETAWAGAFAIGAVYGAALVAWAARREGKAVVLGTGVAFLVAAVVSWAWRAIVIAPTEPVLLGNARALSGLVSAAALLVAARAVRGRPEGSWLRAPFTLAAHACVVVLLTREAHDAFGGEGRPLPAGLDLPNVRQLAYSCIWSVYAIAMVIVGLRARYRPIRVAALGFLMFTILKVFLLDLAFLENPYRILSFVVLGGILVGVSYLYQRYKALLVG